MKSGRWAESERGHENCDRMSPRRGRNMSAQGNALRRGVTSQGTPSPERATQGKARLLRPFRARRWMVGRIPRALPLG